MAVRSGNLEPLKLFKIFRSMLERQMNGLLTLKRGNVRKKAHVVMGSPVRVGSNLEAENLLHALVHDGLISSTEKIEVAEELRQKKEALDAILIRRRLVGAARLQNVERRLGKNRLLDTFGWPDGRFTFEEMELKHDSTVPGIDVVLLLLEAAARVLPDSECARFANAYVDHAVHPTPVLASHHEGFDRIFPGENVATHLGAAIEVRELAARLGDPRATARQICAVVLAGLGNFRLGTEPQGFASMSPGFATPAPLTHESMPLTAPGPEGASAAPEGLPPPPPGMSAPPDLLLPPPPGTGPTHAVLTSPDDVDAPLPPPPGVDHPLPPPPGWEPSQPPRGADAPLPPPPPPGGSVPPPAGPSMSPPPPPGTGAPLPPRPRADVSLPPIPVAGGSLPPPPGPSAAIPPPPSAAPASVPPPPPSAPAHSTAPPTSAPVGRKELRIGLGHSRRAVRPPSVTHRAERVVSRPPSVTEPASAPEGRGASAPPAAGARPPAQSAPPPPAPSPARAPEPLIGAQPSPLEDFVPGSQPLTGFGQKKEASATPPPVAPMRGSARNAQPTRSRETPSAPPAAVSTPPKAAVGKAKETRAKEMPEKIRAKLDEARRLAAELDADKPDHFTVLGVTRDDHEQTVRTAFRGLARDFHVDKFTRYGLDKQDIGAVQTVFIAINRAHEVLTDPDERAEYIAELDMQAQGLKSVRPGDRMDNALRGEKLREDGLTAIKNAKADLALELLGQALEVDAGDRLAQAGKAYAEFMVVQARGSSPQVISRTREVLEKITNDGIEREEPWLYLGRVYRAAEDLRRCVAALERAIEINRHCAEAQSELRHVRRKLEGPQQKKGGLFGRRKK